MKLHYKYVHSTFIQDVCVMLMHLSLKNFITQQRINKLLNAMLLLLFESMAPLDIWLMPPPAEHKT